MEKIMSTSSNSFIIGQETREELDEFAANIIQYYRNTNPEYLLNNALEDDFKISNIEILDIDRGVNSCTFYMGVEIEKGLKFPEFLKFAFDTGHEDVFKRFDVKVQPCNLDYIFFKFKDISYNDSRIFKAHLNYVMTTLTSFLTTCRNELQAIKPEIISGLNGNDNAFCVSESTKEKFFADVQESIISYSMVCNAN